ncbi:MAG: cysteine desulfurase [Flavobacteriaceae bacterium]|nr:cysteine desulfurase [Flavobacteriaceae bacterium]
MLDIKKIRRDFPILSQKVNGKPLVYFDNAATSQKPKVVIDAISAYYQEINSNIHRGVHTLSQLATDAYEETRNKIQKQYNAKYNHEIIFTRGTTESINLIASSFTSLLKKEDEIIISALEHHSNIVPWQMLCKRTGAKLKVIPINKKGELIITEFDKLLNNKTKIVAVSHISNSLGTINPIKNIIDKAHQFNAVVLIDGAQATPHIQVDFQALDCDFYCASSHKMYGPTGIGFLYGKERWLNKLAPYHGGGEMIKEVTFERTTYADLPHKFEAGTPNIEAGIVFGTAIDYINEIGIENIASYENELLQYATEKLLKIEGLKIYGTATKKACVISFNIGKIHPFDIGSIVDKLGFAVRTGHHCTQPIMQFFNIPGTIRASFSFYNTKEEITSFVEALERAKVMLR